VPNIMTICYLSSISGSAALSIDTKLWWFYDITPKRIRLDNEGGTYSNKEMGRCCLDKQYNCLCISYFLL
jgi:hypothetical protein